MKNILKLFKINIFTYIYIIVCFITGYIKEPLIILFIIIVHELGHVFISKYYKYNVLSINIYPFGGITKVDKKLNDPINKDIVIYSFGIIFQLILFLLIFSLFRLNLIRTSIYDTFKYYNKIILLFNLLPIYPLDGFYIINNLLYKKISFYYSLYITIIISFISLVIFFVIFYNNYIIISFLICQLLNYIFNINNNYNRFLLERYLYFFKYKNIKIHNICNLKKLQKECLHYFKQNNNVYNEKNLLAKKFDINRTF